MKYFGFWKEEGYLEMPSILDAVNKSALLDERFEKKLRRYFLLSTSMGYSMPIIHYSIIDGSQLGGQGLISDGKWVWPLEFFDYYKQNKVQFPEEFIEDVKRAYRYPYFMLSFKMLRVRYSTQKIIRAIDQSECLPKLSRDGKHFDLESETTKYKTSILFSIPKVCVKVKIALLELIALSRDDLCLNLLLVVSEVIETKNEIKLRLNTLSLEAVFFEKYLNQDFWLSRVYLDQNVDLEDRNDSEIKKATLERIEVLS